MRKRLPKSLRKYIRREKARIRQEVLDLKEQERLISEIYPRAKQAPTPKFGGEGQEQSPSAAKKQS